MKVAFKLATMTAAIIGAVMPVVPANAQSGGEPMYVYAYFSDASYSTQVGGSRPSCTRNGVLYSRYGMETVFVQHEIAAYCLDGRVNPD
jgi:hypothetical protein